MNETLFIDDDYDGQVITFDRHFPHHFNTKCSTLNNIDWFKVVAKFGTCSTSTANAS
jgi:hypothetical protein